MLENLKALTTHINQAHQSVKDYSNRLFGEKAEAVQPEEYNSTSSVFYSHIYDEVYMPFITAFHKSILAGDYYVNGIDIELNQIQASIDEIQNLIPKEYEDTFEFSVVTLISEIGEHIRIYKSFSEHLKHRLEHHHDVLMVAENQAEREISQENLQQLIEELGRRENEENMLIISYYRLLFRLSLKLAYIDSTLLCSKATLPGLLSLNRFFSRNEKIRVLPVAKILFDKGLYLQSKILKRFGTDSQENLDRQFYPNYQAPLFLDGQAVQTDEDSIEHYRHFFELTRELYSNVVPDFSRETQKIMELEEKVLTGLERSSTINYVDISRLSKSYYVYPSKIENSIQRSKKLLDAVQAKRVNTDKERIGVFDEYSHQSLISQLYCNYLKAIHGLLKEKILQKSPHSEILECKKKLDDAFSMADAVAETTKIKTYNPYRVYVDGYRLYLNYERNADNPDFTIENLNNALNNVLTQFMPYERNLDWAEERNLQTLYLPYVECFVDKSIIVDDQEFKLFLDSSFVLPINPDYLKREHNYLYEALQTERSWLTHQLISKSIREVEQLVEARKKELEQSLSNVTASLEQNVQQKISENQLRNIEILSLFSAILAFIVGGVATLPKFHDFYIMSLFLFGLAMCLGIFVMFIDYVLQKRFHRGALMPVIVSILIFIGAIYVKIQWPKRTLLPFESEQKEDVKESVQKNTLPAKATNSNDTTTKH